MNKWETVGTYLGRIVRAIQLAPMYSESSFNADASLSTSLVLICIDSKFPVIDLDLLLEELVKHAPLAVVLAGKGAEEAFDYLLDLLARRPIEVPVMTKLCLERNFSEVASDFLSATWPAQGRFDEWESYSVVALGGDASRYSRLLANLRKLIDA